MRIKRLAPPVEVEPPRSGEDAADCVACNTPDDAYIWVSERWRVRAMDRPTGLPMVLILECRSHLDLGDLPNLLAAELGVMTVRLERAIRSLDGVARVHVNRWGDGSAHLHMWFLARPYGRLQLRGTFLSLWDDILPVIPEQQWRENLALVAAWLAEFGGHANAEPAHIQWQSPSTLRDSPSAASMRDFAASDGTAIGTAAVDSAVHSEAVHGEKPDIQSSDAEGSDIQGSQTEGSDIQGSDPGGSHTGGSDIQGRQTTGQPETASQRTGEHYTGRPDIAPREETGGRGTGSDSLGAAGARAEGVGTENTRRRPADLADFEGSKADIRPAGTAFVDSATPDLGGSTVPAGSVEDVPGSTTIAPPGQRAGDDAAASEVDRTPRSDAVPTGPGEVVVIADESPDNADSNELRPTSAPSQATRQPDAEASAHP